MKNLATRIIYRYLSDLSDEQANRMSEICMGIGHIALASVALPAVIDKSDAILLLWGLATAMLFWLASILILRRKSD